MVLRVIVSGPGDSAARRNRKKGPGAHAGARDFAWFACEEDRRSVGYSWCWRPPAPGRPNRGHVMTIRTFDAGDEATQVSIYNEAAADLPRYKPATLDEVRRRWRAPDFDRTARFSPSPAIGPVAYAGFQANAASAYPWCRKGHEALAEPLFAHVLAEMKKRGLARAFAAYRGRLADGCASSFCATISRGARDGQLHARTSWRCRRPRRRAQQHHLAVDSRRHPRRARPRRRCASAQTIPPTSRPNCSATPITPRARCSPCGAGPMARRWRLGVLIANSAYANPKQVDAAMPCFRPRCVRTEGMSTKRINGVFSFPGRRHARRDAVCAGPDGLRHVSVARNHGRDVPRRRCRPTVPHLVRFYKQHFRRQGSFPIFERAL